MQSQNTQQTPGMRHEAVLTLLTIWMTPRAENTKMALFFSSTGPPSPADASWSKFDCVSSESLSNCSACLQGTTVVCSMPGQLAGAYPRRAPFDALVWQVLNAVLGAGRTVCSAVQ